MNNSIAFDRAADYYDQTRGFPPGQEIPVAALLAKAGGWNASSHVLEIGVGTGRIALPLAACVAAVYGVDLSRPMMSRLRSKQRSESVYLVQGDASRLPFRPNVFDGVIAVHVLHLIPNWRDVLAELSRALRPGAPLVRGWGQEHDAFHDLWKIFNTVVHSKENTPVGAPIRTNPNLLEDEGWQPAGDVQEHTYTRSRTPNEFLQQIKDRVWSSLWRVNDEDLARGLAAMQTALVKRYSSLDQPITAHASFYARAYLPP